MKHALLILVFLALSIISHAQTKEYLALEIIEGYGNIEYIVEGEKIVDRGKINDIHETLTNTLNKLSKEGWEVVTLGGAQRSMVILERKKR